MNRYVVLLASVFLVITAAGAVDAADVTVEPGNTLWQSEEFSVHADCIPTANQSEEYTVYVENISKGGETAYPESSELPFNYMEGSFVLDGDAVKQFLNGVYGYEAGGYTFFTTCEEIDGSAAATVKNTFEVERLTMTMQDDLTADSYFADEEENVSLVLKREGKGNAKIVGGGSEVQFDITADDESLPVSRYYQTSSNAWVLNTVFPDEPGDYTVTLTASHDDATATVERDITVQDTLQFAITPSTQQVSAGETIELDIDAVYEGEELSLEKDDLDITVDDDSVMDDVTMLDGSTAELTLPEQDPGTYELAVTLDRDGVPSATAEFTVRYPISVVGEFVDREDDPIAYQFQMTQDGDSRMQTSGNGEYAEQVVPGMYNVSLNFHAAELVFRNVDVEEWENPVQYRRYRGDSLPGLRLAGLYSYQTALSYDTAELSLQYDPGAVDNPEQLEVYHCPDWNAGTKTCYGSWSAVSADRDTVNSRMHVDAISEGAYAIGQRTGLGVTYAADDVQSTYTPDDEIVLSGRVRSPAGADVGNASVTVAVDDTDIGTTARTGADGTYDVSLSVPETADTYTIDITAEKDPYRDGSTSVEFDVERPASLDIVAPDSVTASANTTENVSVYVENTGYTTINDLTPETADIPFFSRIAFDGRPLQPGESRSTPVTLQIPANTSTDTHKAEIAFAYGDHTATAVFGLTVEEQETQETGDSTETETTSGMIAGSLAAIPSAGTYLPDIGVPDVSMPFTELVFLIIALQIGVVVIVLVRGRVILDDPQRDQVLHAVSTIKDDVGQAIHTQQSTDTATTPSLRGRNDAVERDNVIRAMDHIKEQLAADH